MVNRVKVIIYFYYNQSIKLRDYIIKRTSLDSINNSYKYALTSSINLANDFKVH